MTWGRGCQPPALGASGLLSLEITAFLVEQPKTEELDFLLLVVTVPAEDLSFRGLYDFRGLL